MIEVQGLTKEYGRFRAVDDLSFRVAPGEVLGFLGPNGAGKTTTMRIVAGFLPPTAGRVLVCGADIETQSVAAKRRIGYLPEGAPSYPEMTPRSFLEFIAEARGIAPSERRKRLDEVFALLHLERVLEQTIDTLSKGYRRRVGLAQAILHDPEVLILDEPTDGLDPNQKHEVRELIGRMAKSKIIVISTHLLEEVEAVCNRAIIIARGKILADDTPRGLEARSRFYNAVSLKLTNPELVPAARNAIKLLPEVASTELDEKNGRITAFPAPGKLPLASINALAERQRWPLAELHLESGRLDEVFRSITGRSRGMSGVMAVFKRELASYFATPIAYVFIVIFLVLAGVVHVLLRRLLRGGPSGSRQGVLLLAPVAVPVPRAGAQHAAVGRGAKIRQHRAPDDAAARDVASRRRQVPRGLGVHCDRDRADVPDLDHRQLSWAIPTTASIVAAYVGSILMAGGFLAVGACISAATKNQVIAFILSVVVCFLLLVPGLGVVQQLLLRHRAAMARRRAREPGRSRRTSTTSAKASSTCAISSISRC